MSSIRNKFKDKQQKTKSDPERFAAFDNAITQLAKADIIVKKELNLLIPPLKEEELVLLKESIKNEGVRDPLLLWKSSENEDVLVDGHNRYRLVKELEEEGHKVKYGTKYLKLESYEAVKSWMIINQLGRRNLTNEQRSYLRGLRYEREKGGHGGERASPQNGNMRTHEKLASEYKVSKNTILRDSEFARGIEKIGSVNPELKTQILTGKASVKKSDLQLLGRQKDELKVGLQSYEDLNTVIKKLKRRPAKKQQIDIRERALKQQLIEAIETVNKETSQQGFVQLHQLLDKLEHALKLKEG